jgi:hypothetical protein
MALALFKGEAIGVDVSVGNDFVDEGHGQWARFWDGGWGPSSRRGPMAIIPSRAHDGKPSLSTPPPPPSERPACGY